MTVVYTDYISKKYKGKKYYIRGWINYQMSETETTKSITFTAGFNTKTRACSMGTIKMDVSDNVGNRATVSKKFNGSSANSSITYIDETTWTWSKEDPTFSPKVTILGTFGSTRFSGKTVKKTITFVLNNVTFTAERDSATQATLSLTVNKGAAPVIQEPIVKKTPLNGYQETLHPTWYSNGEKITFPYTIPSLPIEFTAVDSIDEMHSYDYDVTATVGDISFVDSDSINYIYYPEWEVTVDITGAMPETNHYGNAWINVYASRNGTSFALLPDDDGWEITQNGSNWSLTLWLKEQYVADPTSHNSQVYIKVEYDTYTTGTSERNIAIYSTNRNANFSTGLANNVFIGGCTIPEYSSRVWYSAVNNPLYMPDLNYIEVGSTDTRVMGLVKVGDYLGVIKQSNATDTSVYLVYPTSFEDETTFATKPCVGGVGALGEFCFNVLGDETLFLSPRGVMAIEPYEDEQSRVKDRSFFVNGRLLEEVDLQKAYSFVWKGMYLLAVNNHVYVLDGSQRNSWGNQKTNLVYECYFLDNVPAKCMFSYNDQLWFSDGEGNLCRFKDPTEEDAYRDDNGNVTAVWSTIADDDGSLQYFKSMTKKGNLVSLLPEEGTRATVYLKKDEEEMLRITESQPLEAWKVLPSSVYIKKKMKKYTRLQFIVEDNSDSPFGINMIVKSYTIGNYAK